MAAVLVIAGPAMTGCSGGSAADRTPTSSLGRGATLPVSREPLIAPDVTVTRNLGPTVTGGFGRRPRVKLSAGAPPQGVTVQVLTAGTGATVSLGHILIAHYQVLTWGSATSKPVVVDDSFARGLPVAAVVGAGNVLKGWDAALVGQKAGSRVLVALPGDPAPTVAPTGGATGQARPGVPAGPALLAVVDILAALPKDKAADGATVSSRPGAGLPAVRSEPGRRPEVTRTTGVTPTVARSQLLLAGSGTAIVPRRTLVLQTIQVDAVTHRTVSQTWGGAPVLMRADQLLPTVPVLARSRVGSRAVAVLPASGTGHPQILVVDVLAQL